MLRKIAAFAVAGMLCSPLAGQAADYSPSQAELNSVEFADFWPGNGASLDMKTLIDPQMGPPGTNPNPGVQYQFDTGLADPPDTFGSRTQFEAPFTTPLSSFDAFSINFLAVQSANPLQAQVFLRHGPGGAGATYSGGVNLNGTSQTTVSIPIGVIPEADRDAITAFVIEIYSLANPSDPFFETETDSLVSAFTTPQYVDSYLISGFEGDGSGSLEGWGAAFQPDHISHTLLSSTPQLPEHPPNNGVTQGTHALEIVRSYTGQGLPGEEENLAFRWGSQMVLNAGGGGSANGDYNDDSRVDAGDYVRWRNALAGNGTIANETVSIGTVDGEDYTEWKNNYGSTGGGGDPVQERIEDIVAAINSGDQIAMDISFTAIDNFETGEPNPTYAIFHMFIQDGQTGANEAFWQSDSFATINAPPLGESVTATLVASLDSFTDRDPMPVAGNLRDFTLVPSPTFTLGIASNTNGRLTFQIDNIRVRTLAEGSGGLSTVPEPASVLLAALAMLVPAAVRRRSHRDC